MSGRKERAVLCLKKLTEGLKKERGVGWLVAELLHEIQTEEYWKDLKYPSFFAFLGKETNLSLEKARTKIKEFEKALSLGFTSEELQSKGYPPSYIRTIFDLEESKKPKAISLIRSERGLRKFPSVYRKKNITSQSVSDDFDLRRAVIVLNANSAEVAEETRELLEKYCQEKKEAFTCNALLSLLQEHFKKKNAPKVQSRGLVLPRIRREARA